MQKEVSSTHESSATKLTFKKLIGESKGILQYGDIVGIFSEDASHRLDIGLDGVKKEVPATHNSWATRFNIKESDPLVDFKIKDISYDVEKTTILSTGKFSLFRQTVENLGEIEQTSTISGSESVNESSGWSNTLGAKIGAKTEFKCGVPLLAEGKIELSAEVSNSYQWNGSTTKSKTWGFNTPIKVPAYSKGTVIVVVSISTISVPYKLNGTRIYKSGKETTGYIDGVYTGTNSSDLSITFSKFSMIDNNITTNTIKI